ncbi:P-loop containing nucleoside triphosphate hydrolase protein [Boletus reticuloceps]|uniref:DNA 3'-5' helicase n=1 Tax=Boletus reticuloceps TaxID=495285 RepID=A0A8I2YF17_9AGAM|nr:P-loop containing nucleoside triphosphate hydrolase protein [Boletus reticuloceps]
MPNSDNLEICIPMLAEIHAQTEDVFGHRPCLWQQKVAQALLHQDQDVICIAGTGKGKTLTFWMPLLFSRTSIQIIITPLNLLGEQNVRALEKAGIRAISICAETATIQNFQRVVIISPEQVMKDGDFKQLLKKSLFTSHIIGVVIDEAHCVSTWGEFHPKYRELGRLRYIMPDIPLLVASATLSPEALWDVTRLLHLWNGNRLVTIHHSTDRPNIKLAVRAIQGSL